MLNNDHNHNDLSAFSCEVNEKFLEFPKNYDSWKKWTDDDKSFHSKKMLKTIVNAEEREVEIERRGDKKNDDDCLSKISAKARSTEPRSRVMTRKTPTQLSCPKRRTPSTTPRCFSNTFTLRTFVLSPLSAPIR